MALCSESTGSSVAPDLAAPRPARARRRRPGFPCWRAPRCRRGRARPGCGAARRRRRSPPWSSRPARLAASTTASGPAAASIPVPARASRSAAWRRGRRPPPAGRTTGSAWAASDATSRLATSASTTKVPGAAASSSARVLRPTEPVLPSTEMRRGGTVGTAWSLSSPDRPAPGPSSSTQQRRRGRRRKYAIQPVQQAAVPGDQRGCVLHMEAPLEPDSNRSPACASTPRMAATSSTEAAATCRLHAHRPPASRPPWRRRGRPRRPTRSCWARWPAPASARRTAGRQIGADVARPDHQEQEQHVAEPGRRIAAQIDQRNPGQADVDHAEASQRRPAAPGGTAAPTTPHSATNAAASTASAASVAPIQPPARAATSTATGTARPGSRRVEKPHSRTRLPAQQRHGGRHERGPGLGRRARCRAIAAGTSSAARQRPLAQVRPARAGGRGHLGPHHAWTLHPGGRRSGARAGRNSAMASSRARRRSPARAHPGRRTRHRPPARAGNSTAAARRWCG